MRPTVRVRLAALYGALSLATGVLLTGLSFVLVRNAISDATDAVRQPALVLVRMPGPLGGPAEVVPVDPANVTTGDGRTLDQLESDQRSQVREHAQSQVFVSLSIALLVAAAAAVAVGWLVAGRTLRPLHEMTEKARRLGSSSLHQRIALSGPDDEIKELADTFDDMLDRIEASFASQRRFAANASHELRTPLTLQRTLVEVAASRPDASPDLRELAPKLLAAIEREEGMLEGLLLLARSENGLERSLPVDLAAVAADVTDAAGPAALRADVAVDTVLHPTLVEADPVLLERLVANLVQNAVLHNVPRGWVRVTVSPGTLQVTNSGPVIPPGEVAGLVEPFRRLGRDRTRSASGVGLGLSIVRAVAAAHDADLSIAARPTGGLDVIVRFPPSGAPSTQRRQGVTGRDAASASGAAGPGVDVSLHP